MRPQLLSNRLEIDCQPVPQGRATTQRNICPQAPAAHKCQRKLKVPSSRGSPEKARGPLALKGTGVSIHEGRCLEDQKPDDGVYGNFLPQHPERAPWSS